MFKWCNDCQVGIFEIKLMVKIGVIIMLFSNPTFHFRDTADFTSSTYNTTVKLAVPLELEMMVKIGVIIMSFSNSTCHFRAQKC